MAATIHPDQENTQSEPPMECAVCLQTCIHPVQLPCRHIFCFLCVKGVSTQVSCVNEAPVWFNHGRYMIHAPNPLKSKR